MKHPVKKVLDIEPGGAATQPMPEDALDLIPILLKRFGDRAKSLRRTAMGILAAIFLLLLGGAIIFPFAGQITLADFNAKPDYDKKIDDLQNQFDQLVGRSNGLRKPLVDNYRRIVGQFEAYNMPQTNPETVEDVSFQVDPADPLIITKIITGPLNFGAPQYRRISLILYHSSEYFSPPVSFIIRPEALDKIKDALRSVKLKEYKGDEEVHQIGSKINLVRQAIEIVERQKTVDAVAPLTGLRSIQGDQRLKVPEGPPQVPLAQIIQTNITRFGAIIMIIFLVSILAPLYRYNLRLAAFYDARADALLLMDTKLKSPGLVRLIDSLTPTFDFGKAPPTPIEQLIQLVKAVTDREKTTEKDKSD